MFDTIPLFYTLRDQGISPPAVARHIADLMGYKSDVFVKQVLFMDKQMSMDLKQRWSEALDLDLEVAFPEVKDHKRYLPPLQVDEDRAQLAARILSICELFREIETQLETDGAAQIILGEKPNDVGLMQFFSDRLVQIKQQINDTERLLNTLGIDVDQSYERTKR